MTEQNEAEFDDYVNMIEKVLGRQSSTTLTSDDY